MSILEHLADGEFEALPMTYITWYSFIENGDYTPEQQGRFELYADEHPTDPRWEDACATWHLDVIHALLYLAFVRSKGAEAVLLRDEASGRMGSPHTEHAVVTLGYEGHAKLLASMTANRALHDQERAVRLNETERKVWAAWNALPEGHPAPAKAVARELGMETADVAFIVFPAEQFGPWTDDREPDLPEAPST